jgi:hypothetical protein
MQDARGWWRRWHKREMIVKMWTLHAVAGADSTEWNAVQE